MNLLSEVRMRKIIGIIVFIILLCGTGCGIYFGVQYYNLNNSTQSGNSSVSDEEINNLESQIAELISEKDSLIDELAQTKLDLEEALSKNEDYETRIQPLLLEIDTLESQLSILESEISGLESLLEQYEEIANQTHEITFYLGREVYCTRAVLHNNTLNEIIRPEDTENYKFLYWTFGGTEYTPEEISNMKFTGTEGVGGYNFYAYGYTAVDYYVISETDYENKILDNAEYLGKIWYDNDGFGGYIEFNTPYQIYDPIICTETFETFDSNLAGQGYYDTAYIVDNQKVIWDEEYQVTNNSGYYFSPDANQNFGIWSGGDYSKVESLTFDSVEITLSTGESAVIDFSEFTLSDEDAYYWPKYYVYNETVEFTSENSSKSVDLSLGFEMVSNYSISLYVYNSGTYNVKINSLCLDFDFMSCYEIENVYVEV